MSDLTTWLKKHGLEGCASVLIDNDVDLDVLPEITDADLKAIGISLGNRRRILAAARQLQANEDQGQPMPDPDSQDILGRAERRQLSVMFCDLVGSTELSQEVDPEQLREIMRVYQDAASGSVTRYEGFVAKFLGDGILAYFGWPQAYEDQAERAVRAALEIVKNLGDLKPIGERKLQARVGIATGHVVVGDIVGEALGEVGAIAGHTPNLAARLQAIAEPGGVVVDETTRTLLGHAFQLEGGDREQLKGFSKPVAAWRVVGERRAESRFDAAHGGPLVGFVGREPEISLLKERWGRTKDSEGQVVLLSGEAGIGKSRILREFTAHLDDGPARPLRYQCSPYHVNAAFHPIIEQIQNEAKILHEDSSAERLDKLEKLLSSDAECAPPAPALVAALLSLPTERYPPLEMTPQKQKLLTIDVLCRQVLERADQGPLLVLVEDAHWMDPSTLEFFDEVVERVQALPIMVVITCRPEFDARWTEHGHVTAHSLKRLGYGDCRELTKRVTRDKDLPDEIITMILEQTDGVPLFVEELTKVVLETGILEERSDHYEMLGPLHSLAIPKTLNDSLMARIDRLAPLKEIIQTAACIGREFDAALLEAVMPERTDALENALDQLVQSGLLFRRRSEEGTRYVFKHALVQDAAYESLLRSKRKKVHAELARVVEERQDSEPLDLARHYASAEMLEEAARCYLAAGKFSLAASALSEAVNALELGLSQVQSLDPGPARNRLELDLRVALGTARMAKHGWPHPSVAEAMEPAFDLALQLEDRKSLGPLLWGLWVHYQTRTEFAEALAWLDKLEKTAAEMADPELLAVRDMSGGCQYFWQAEYDKAASYTDHIKATYNLALHGRIVEYANHDPLCFSLHWAGSLLDWITGYPDRAVQRLDEALELARNLGHPFNSAFALTAGSQCLIMRGESERMLAHCDEAEKIIAEEGLGGFAENSMVNHWRGQALIVRRDFEVGYDLAKRGNDFFNASGGRICNAMWWSLMAIALDAMGRPVDAEALIERAISHCRKTGDRYMEPEALRIKGEFARANDSANPAAAEALLSESITVARLHGAKSWELRAATSLAKLSLARDRRTEAYDLLQPVYDDFTEGFDTSDLVSARSLLNELR